METREERLVQLSLETHTCPYCKEELKLCNAPPFALGDGLGWGDVFWLCLNDECPLFVTSWDVFKKRYGKHSSARFVLCPGETSGTPMLVCSVDAFKGSEVDVLAIMAKKNLASRKRIFAIHETLNELMNELKTLNECELLPDNVCYIETLKRCFDNVLKNFLTRKRNQ
jgi:hypothetical protein